MNASLIALCRVFFALGFLASFQSVFGQIHPRLLFNATEGAALQARSGGQPYAAMLSRIRDLTAQSGWALNNTKAVDFATLYYFENNPADAERAAHASLHSIAGPTIFDSSKMSIARGYELMHVALAYDLCANSAYYNNTVVPSSFVSFIDGVTYTVPAAYVGLTYKNAISLALKNAADLLVSSGGTGWPGDGSTGNNWFSLRYGGAVLCYLATDTAYDSANFNTALTKLRSYLRDNLTATDDARGWNPEGYGYNFFPARTTLLTALALKRSGGADLIAEYPALRYTSWSTLPGTLPIDFRFDDNWANGTLDEVARGIHPDVTDDNPQYIGEGVPYLALAVAHSSGGSGPDFDYRSGIRWMIDRYWGATADGGNNHWDFYRGAGLLGLLYYPDPSDSNAPASVNPASVWGKTYSDPSHGVTIMRNRYQDANDIVFQASANARKNYGGHYGMDALAPRLIGLGVPWIVGPGRVVDAKGESTLLPSDPQGFAAGDNGITAVGNRVHDSFLRTNGDGYLILKSELSDTGVETQTRRYLMDYSGVSGAAAVMVISDSSANGKFWRLQTHGDNTVSTSGNSFTCTGPGGQIMTGTVVAPASVTLRTGTFARGSGWKTAAGEVLTNKWIDFENTGTNGEFLVVLTVNNTGTTIPTVTGSLVSPGNWSVSVPGRTFSGAGDVLTVSGWNRPSIAITSPLENANYNAGASTIDLAGVAADTAGGVIKKIEVYLDGTLKSSTAYNLSSVNWSASVPSVPVGEHALMVRAIDNDNDTRDAVVHVKVNNTVPPQDVAISSPGTGDSFAPGSTLLLQGTAYDPENALARVEIWRDGIKIGNATYTVATKTWTYSVPVLATGFYNFEAIAYDTAGDYTSSGLLSVRCSQTFSPISQWGDASQYYVSDGATMVSPALTTAAITSSPRWHVRDFEGDLRLHTWVGPTYDAFHSLIFRGTPPKNYTLRYKVKNIGTNKPGYNLSLTPTLNLQMRDVNAVFDTRAWVGWLTSGTSLWIAEPTGGYGYAGTVGFDTSVNGGTYTPTSTHAGVLGTNWTDVEIRKLDKNLLVKLRPTGQSTYQTIMNVTDFAIGGSGRLNITGRKLNDMGLNTEAYFDDIELIELDASGNPVTNAATSVAFVSPVSGSSLTGSVLNIAATVSDADGIASVEYFAGSRGLGFASLQSGQWKLSWQYPPTGDHGIYARVTDSKGNVFTSPSSTIDITSQGGPVTAVATGTPLSGTAPLPVTFSATGSSSLQGSIVSYVWTFGDGTSSTAASPSHTYAAPGIYTANLTLTDSVGNQGYASVQISAAYPAGSDPVLIDDDFSANTTAEWDILSATTLGTVPTEFYSATGGTNNFNGVGVLLAKGYHNGTSSTQSALQFQSFGAVRDINTATFSTTGIHSDKGQVYLAVRYFDGGVTRWAVSGESIRTTFGSKSGGWAPVAGSWTLANRIWKALDTANLNAGGGATLSTSLVLTNADAAGFYSLSTGTWMTTGLGVVDSYTLANSITATAPSFTQQPSNLTVNAGDNASFSAAASGYPAPTYQWTKNGVDIAGATSATYSITATVAGDAGSYRVVVSNSEGLVTSSAATLTVNVAPDITAQPASVTVTTGASASFTVVATGTPAPVYQWKKDGADIAGATSANYTIAATAPGDAGGYTVVVTNSAGSAISNTADLTVNSAAPTGIAETFPDSSITAQWQFIGSNSLGSNPPTETWRQNGVDSLAWAGGALGSAAWHSATGSTQATLNYRVLSGVTDLTNSTFSTGGIHARSSTAKFAVRYTEGGVTQWAVSTNSIRTTTGYTAAGWAPVPGSWELSSFTWKSVDAANLSAGEGAAVAAATVLQNADAVGVYGLFTGTWLSTKFPQITSFNLTGANAEGSGPPSGPPVVFNLETSSWISGPDSGAGVMGSIIQADGTVILAANLENATLPAVPVTLLGSATASSQGAILRLSADGRTLLGISRVAAVVYDLAEDAVGNLYVAAGIDGALKLNSTASALVWTRRAGQFVYRIDAGTDGTAAALIPGTTTVERDNKANAGTIFVINSAGTEVSSFSGYGHTLDVTVDSATSTVVYCGWYNFNTYTGPYARGYNGNTTVPVDIPYFRGVPYDYGQAGVSIKWMGHGWESNVWLDQANLVPNPRWVNAPFSTAASNLYTQAEVDALEVSEARADGYYQFLLNNPKNFSNNMADTRAYRCAMGRDGLLYIGNETAGGNTPLRFKNSDLGTTVIWTEADGFFDQFFNTSTVYKLVIGRYEVTPAAAVEQLVFGFTNRVTDPLRSSTDNTIYMRGGGLSADETGRVYITGGCNSGYYLPGNTLPTFDIPRAGEVAFDPFDPAGTLGEYTGGSYLMVMNSTATKRLYTSRLAGGGAASVDARATGANAVTRLVMGGLVDNTIGTMGSSQSGMNKLHTSQAIQGTRAAGSTSDGFFSVVTVTDPNYAATPIAPTITAQPVSVTVTAGDAASFSVTATGVPAPTYQWRKNGADINGATSATFSIAMAATGDAGDYSVVASNSAGSMTSAAATFTVNTAPVISQQPAGLIVTAGGNASFTVVATGSNLSYQWKKDGVDIPNATAGTYTINTTTVEDTGNYTCLVLNSAGSITSAVATLTVNPAPPLTGGTQWKNLDLRGMGFVTGILTHPVSGEIYTRTDVAGVFRWDAAASRWVALLDDFGNQIPDTRNVESFALDSNNPNRLFVAYGSYVEESAGTHGILRSDDKGLTWTTTNLSSAVRMGGNSEWRHAGERLAVDPANSDVVYFGSRQNGLWRSSDGGMNWSQIAGVPYGGNNGATRNSLPVNGGITFVTIDSASTTAANGPLRSAIVYLGIMDVGVYRSTDGGNSFTLLGTQPAVATSPIQGKLASDGTLYVTLTNGVWRWRSNAWAVITPPVSGFTYSNRKWAAVAVDPANPDRIAINDTGNTPRDLFISSDAGATWINHTTDPANAFPAGRHKAVTFTLPPWIAESDQKFSWSGAITFAPGNSNQIWLTTGYAVYVYQDLAASLVSANGDDFMAGLEELVGTRVLPLPAAGGGGVVAGVMDKSGFVIRDPEATPTVHLGNAAIANSTGIGISAQTNTIVASLASGNYDAGQVVASDNGGTTWRTLGKPFAANPSSGYGMTLGGDIAVSATNINNFVWIPLNPSWYPNDHPPVYSTNGGATWTPVTGLPTSFNGVNNPYFGANNVLAADTVNGNTFYAYHENQSTYVGSIYRSTDGGATWSVRNNGGLPGYWQSILQARPGAEGELWYLSVGSSLRRSLDGGATFTILPGWTDVSAFGFGAPHPGQAKNTVYAVGTRGGIYDIYCSTDDCVTWTRPTGLGPVPLSMISSISGDLALPGRIYLATGGRGLFYVDLFNSAPASTPLITQQPASVTVTEGGSVSFSVTATGSPAPTYQWLKNGVELVGEIDATLEFSAAVLTDAGSYTVVVTNSADSVTSAAALLTVNEPAGSGLVDDTFPDAASISGWSFIGSNSLGSNPPLAQWRQTGVNSFAWTQGNLGSLAWHSATNSTQATLNYKMLAAAADLSTATFVTAGIHANSTAKLAVRYLEGGVTKWAVSTNSIRTTTGYNATGWVPVAATWELADFTWKSIDAANLSAGEGSAVNAATVLANADAVGVYGLLAGTWLKERFPQIVSFTISGAGTPPAVIAPTITQQPVGMTVISGQGASFTVTATGLPAPIYQWRKDGTDISGATSAVFTIANAAVGDAGDYTVVASNGGGSATSATATLTVNTAPVITQQPASVTVTAGGSASFSVSASGSPAPTYQWRRDGVDLAGQTAATLVLSGVSPGDAANYSVVVSNGIDAVTSSNATLTVNVIPVITQQPANVTVTAGAGASFTVTASGSPLPGYQWRKDGLDLAGQTGATLNLAATVSGDAGNYTVVVTNSAGSVTSSPAILTVNTIPAPVVTSAASAEALEWVAFSYAITATGSPASFGATGLPAGLTLDALTGVISGTMARGTSGDYLVTIRATNAGGTGSAILQLSVTESWVSQDIGSTSPAGSLIWSADGETATIKGAGADIFGTADAFHYARVEGGLNGDGEIIARIVSVENKNSWTKAGVMMRETTAANSRFVYIIQRPDKMVQFGWRASTGGSAATVPVTGGTAAVKFVRLVRTGGSFSAYYSTTSATGPWTQIDTARSIPMASNIEVGLAVTSHTNGTLAAAVFDSISLLDY